MEFRTWAKTAYAERLVMPIRQELCEHLLPFWLSLSGEGQPSIGLVDAERVRHPDAPRGLVYTSRMLWTYASLCELPGLAEAYGLRQAAERELELLRSVFYDREWGGYYLLCSADGEVLDESKLIYAQCFVLYALAAWYRVAGGAEVLEEAQALYGLIEGCTRRLAGQVVHGEAYTRDYNSYSENLLAEQTPGVELSLNQTLHMIEAYTELYRVWPDVGLRAALVRLLDLMLTKLYVEAEGKLHVYLDAELEPVHDDWSLGHDIEAAWLVEHTADVLAQNTVSAEEAALLRDIHAMCRRLEDAVLPRALEAIVLPDGRPGLWHAQAVVGGQLDRTRVWWVQAEAICALVNAAIRREDASYLEQAVQLWDSMACYLVDSTPGGEWHQELDLDQRPKRLNIADPWKAFYHNGRMCIQVIKTLNDFS